MSFRLSLNANNPSVDQGEIDQAQGGAIGDHEVARC
jgi:hypothetical protein